MAQIIPLSGTVNGYSYEFVHQSFGCTTYIIHAPSGEKIMVKCYTADDINEVTKTPDQLWKRQCG